MERQITITTDGSTWGVVKSELSLLEVLKVAEQLVAAINNGQGEKLFAHPILKTQERVELEQRNAVATFKSQRSSLEKALADLDERDRFVKAADAESKESEDQD